MDIVTYALCKKIAAGAVSGISKLEVEGTKLKITTKNGQVVTMNFPTPKDGISVTDVAINTSNELLCTLSNGTIINAGIIQTIKGEDGYTPVKGVDYFTAAEIEDFKQEFSTQIDEKISEEINNQLELTIF